MYASFYKYIEEEMMDGPNQYNAEGHGLQVGCGYCVSVDRSVLPRAGCLCVFASVHLCACMLCASACAHVTSIQERPAGRIW